MRTNYVLVDLENVQPDSLDALAQDHFKIILFVGASQSRLPFDLVTSMQRLGPRAEYIKISGNGSNALDFHIAYTIGRIAEADATAYFHIVSKDTGFDPLIEHLKTRKVFAGRVKSIGDIPLVKASTAKSPAERLDVVLSWLDRTKASKPRTLKTLSSTIGSLFQKQLTDADVAALVEALAGQKRLVVSGAKVTYPAPSNG